MSINQQQKVRPEDIEGREEWIEAARECWFTKRPFPEVIAAVLAEIVNNPPDLQEEADKVLLWDKFMNGNRYNSYLPLVSAWLRIAFLKPKPVVPDAIKGMMWDREHVHDQEWSDSNESIAMKHNSDILAAYNAGKKEQS